MGISADILKPFTDNIKLHGSWKRD